MRFKLLIIGAAIAVVATTVGISGFTTATVERQAEINVTDDSGGLVALEPGNESQIISEGGELAINMSETSADGLNQDATFTFGDPNTPNQSKDAHAFEIRNQDDESHDIGLEYSIGADPSNAENVEFVVYDAANVKKFSVTEGGSGAISLGSSESAYVIMNVDTTGVDESETLDGTLNVTA
jgi:hypothetical protein